ncbi:MAG: HNH endonuclease [Methanomassiliicoccales archaeon]|jgi:hypothetical protein
MFNLFRQINKNPVILLCEKTHVLYNVRMKKQIKQKKKKLEKTSKIRRRLMRLWSEKVLSACGRRCAVCGLKTGDIVDGKTQKTDAHHIEDRRNHALKFDVLNGICLCVWHHKYSRNAAHQSIVFFSDWLTKIRPKQFLYVFEHRNDEINLDDREVLCAIEKKLQEPITPEESEILNLKDLDNLENKKKYNPLFNTTTTTSTAKPETLFDL